MDVYDEVIDHEANLFYDNVRTFIVVFLTVASLLPASYVLLNSRRKNKKAYLYKDDVTVHEFVLLVCMTTVSLCVIMVFMLPLSILANEVLILSPDRYYVQWINAGLLHAFFVLVRVAFKGSCFVIPFSFFLLFSHSVNKGNKSLSSRCLYSILYVAVTYIASFGCLIVFVSTILDTFNSSNFTSIHGSLSHFISRACFSSPNFYYSWPIQFLGDVICCIDSALLLTQQSISYIGLALLLICMPSGICGLILKMISFSHSAQPHYQMSSTATYHIDREYRFQLEKCLQYIKTLNKPFHQSADQLICQIGTHSDISCQIPSDGTVPPLKLNEAFLKRPSSVLSTIAFVLLMIVFIASAVSTSVNIIAMLYSLLILRGEETADRSSVSDYIILGHESVSKFGFFGAFLQALMVTLVIFTSVIGFYSLPLVSKHIYPQYHGTSMSLLLFNVTCILAMSSAVPLHASLLGLVNPSFPLVYYSSFLDNNFCRPSSDLCFHPSESVSTSAISILPPSSLQESKQPSSTSSYVQKDPSRESAYLMRRQQILLADIPLDHRSTSTLTPPVAHRAGSKLMALSYSAIFLLICYWFLHKRGLELMRIRDQATSLWCMVGDWWLEDPPSVPSSSSANPIVITPSPT